jgi:hypothetical protein
MSVAHIFTIQVEETENEEEEVLSYWITLRKREDTGKWKRKHYNALCEILALEETMDLL